MLMQIFANDVLSAITQVTTKKVTGFLPMMGREYSGDLMVVGRAVNGWMTEGIAPTELGNNARRLRYARKVYESVTEPDGRKCPMSWVTVQWGVTEDGASNPSRSAFLRVIRAVVSRLHIADVDDDKSPWPSRLVWSNLYKIAPYEGRNPNGNLQHAQFNGCVKLLRWELAKYRPRRVLFLTGCAWADPFLERAWKDRAAPDGYSFVEAVGHVMCGPHAATCVVASHPQDHRQGKNETDWVNEVVTAFGYGICS
jgi:hypothetical protein